MMRAGDCHRQENLDRDLVALFNPRADHEPEATVIPEENTIKVEFLLMPAP
ncbi:hypothetical protein N9195_01820 [bacterium]|nr:hypothetical protein [bacterium]